MGERNRSPATRLVIVVRQSPDWGSIARGVMEHDAVGFDLLTGRPPGTTRRLIELWDETNDSFFKVRARTKEIAERTWHNVAGAEVLPISRFVGPFDDRALYTFTDDDDWFAPQLATRLLSSECDTRSATIWRSGRFDGDVITRPNNGFCYTNNYAFHGSHLNEVDPSRVVQHMDANEVIAKAPDPAILIDDVLSITSKHPCSFTAIELAYKERRALAEQVMRYRDIAPALSVAAQTLAWAVEPMTATAELFMAAGKRAGR
jgi:hypothetical protein